MATGSTEHTARPVRATGANSSRNKKNKSLRKEYLGYVHHSMKDLDRWVLEDFAASVQDISANPAVSGWGWIRDCSSTSATTVWSAVSKLENSTFVGLVLKQGLQGTLTMKTCILLWCVKGSYGLFNCGQPLSWAQPAQLLGSHVCRVLPGPALNTRAVHSLAWKRRLMLLPTGLHVLLSYHLSWNNTLEEINSIFKSQRWGIYC